MMAEMIFAKNRPVARPKLRPPRARQQEIGAAPGLFAR